MNRFTIKTASETYYSHTRKSAEAAAMYLLQQGADAITIEDNGKINMINVIVTDHIDDDITIADMRVINAYSVTSSCDTELDPKEVYEGAFETAQREFPNANRIGVHISF